MRHSHRQAGIHAGLAVAALLATAAGAGTIAKYNFDIFTGGYTVYADISGNGHDATFTSSATPSDDNPTNDCRSMSVVLPDDPGGVRYFTLASPGTINLNNGGRNQFTIEAWVKPQPMGAPHSMVLFDIMHTVESPGIYQILYLSYDYHPLASFFYTGYGYIELTAPDVLPTNVWSHIAYEYDGASMRIYVNAQEVTNLFIGLPLPTNMNYAYMGQSSSCLLDDVRLSDTNLPAAQLGYYGSFSTNLPDAATANTVAKYNFDSLGNGTNVTDISGHSHDAAFGTPVSLSSSAPFSVQLDKSLSLPQSGAQIAYLANPGTIDVTSKGALTMECWIKPLGAVDSSSWPVRLTRTTPAGDEMYQWLGIDTGNHPFVNFFRSTWYTITATNALPTNQWSHVAYTYTSIDARMRLYINGQQAAATTYVPLSLPAAGFDNAILGQGGNYLLDDVRICSTNLPRSQFGYYGSFTFPPRGAIFRFQ